MRTKENNWSNGNIIEKVCPVCKKTFVPASEHVYKDKRKIRGEYVCSYTCMMKTIHEREKREAEKEMKRNEKKRKKAEGCLQT